jgi:hypothetical protein
MGHRSVTGHLRAACRGRSLPGAAVAVLSISLGSVLLAACGSVPAPGSVGAPAGSGGAASPTAAASPSPSAGTSASPGTGQAALCRDASTVTSLRIVRAPGPRIPQEQAVVPGQVIVTSPAHAQEVARALCALPTMRHGLISCPAMFPGTNYQLTFTADGQQLPPVTIEATGCATVTGVGPVRQALSASFWRVLAVAAGVSPPDQATFASPIPGAGCPPPKSGAKISGCPALLQPSGAQSGSAAAS